MDQATHNKIVCFIWGIAGDVLRDLFTRGKYPDVILPEFDFMLANVASKMNDTSTLGSRIAIEKEAAGLLDGLLKASQR